MRSSKRPAGCALFISRGPSPSTIVSTRSASGLKARTTTPRAVGCAPSMACGSEELSASRRSSSARRTVGAPVPPCVFCCPGLFGIRHHPDDSSNLRLFGFMLLSQRDGREAECEHEVARLFVERRARLRGLVDYLLRAFEVRFESEFAPQLDERARRANLLCRGPQDDGARGVCDGLLEDARDGRAVEREAEARGLARNL